MRTLIGGYLSMIHQWLHASSLQLLCSFICSGDIGGEHKRPPQATAMMAYDSVLYTRNPVICAVYAHSVDSAQSNLLSRQRT